MCAEISEHNYPSKKAFALVGLACIPFAASLFLADQSEKMIICPFRAVTGLPCPFCGTTRATLYFLQGSGKGFDYNYFWVFALPVIALLLFNRRVRNFLNGPRALAAFALLLLAGWVVAFSNFTAITS